MPRGSDWVNFIYVNILFILQISIVYSYLSILDIQENWLKYRNNPLFLIFSSDIQKDFTHLIQNIQANFMGYLLEPLTYITSNLASLGGNLTNSLQDTRTVISNVRTFISTLGENIMGIFLNLIIEFQKIVIKMKDLVGKLVGIMVVILYTIETCIRTMQSGWNGPPGEIVRKIADFACFHPDTKVLLVGGRVKRMKHLALCDVLEDGSVVSVLLKLTKSREDVFYRFSGGVEGSPIYVTGEHLIMSSELGEYTAVKNHPDAVLEKGMESDYLSCIITNTHQIKLGTRVFHDWDDDETCRKIQRFERE